MYVRTYLHLYLCICADDNICEPFYMHTCVCVCVCTRECPVLYCSSFMYTQTCMCICMCVNHPSMFQQQMRLLSVRMSKYVRLFKNVYIETNICIYTHAPVSTWLHPYTHTYIHVCMHVTVHFTHACTYSCTHPYQYIHTHVDYH